MAKRTTLPLYLEFIGWIILVIGPISTIKGLSIGVYHNHGIIYVITFVFIIIGILLIMLGKHLKKNKESFINT